MDTKFKKKRIPWNKGKTYHNNYVCSEETKKIISLANKGRKRTEEYCKRASMMRLGQVAWNKGLTGIHSEEGKKRIGDTWRGKHIPEETKLKMSLAHKGEKAHQWKGGIAVINNGLRKAYEYRIWRKEIFKRDNYTCQICSKKGGNLNAHHIEPWSVNKDLRFDMNNGITLCKDCHFSLVNKNEMDWISYFSFVIKNGLYKDLFISYGI